MPPAGVKKGTKRARQYEKIKKSVKGQGASESRAEEIAARTVNKEKARAGESRTASRTSTQDMSSSRRGGQRSGTNRTKGRTRDQLYNEAKNLGIDGRSSMNKAQLQRAIAGKKSWKWWGQDSNLRRLSQRVYSPSPLTAREPHHAGVELATRAKRLERTARLDLECRVLRAPSRILVPPSTSVAGMNQRLPSATCTNR